MGVAVHGPMSGVAKVRPSDFTPHHGTACVLVASWAQDASVWDAAVAGGQIPCALAGRNAGVGLQPMLVPLPGVSRILPAAPVVQSTALASSAGRLLFLSIPMYRIRRRLNKPMFGERGPSTLTYLVSVLLLIWYLFGIAARTRKPIDLVIVWVTRTFS